MLGASWGDSHAAGLAVTLAALLHPNLMQIDSTWLQAQQLAWRPLGVLPWSLQHSAAEAGALSLQLAKLAPSL